MRTTVVEPEYEPPKRYAMFTFGTQQTQESDQAGPLRWDKES